MAKVDDSELGKAPKGHMGHLMEIAGVSKNIPILCYRLATIRSPLDTRTAMPDSVGTTSSASRCGEGNAAAPDEPLPLKEDNRWE